MPTATAVCALREHAVANILPLPNDLSQILRSMRAESAVSGGPRAPEIVGGSGPMKRGERAPGVIPRCVLAANYCRPVAAPSTD